MDDYRSIYPNSLVQRSVLSKERRKELGRRHAEWFKTGDVTAYRNGRSFPSEVKHWLRKGLSQADAEAKVAEYQRIAALKQNNPVTQAKKSLRNSGKNNPMSLQSIANRHGISLDEASLMTPTHGRVGEKHPMWGKHHTFEALQKIGQHLTISNVSKPEQHIAEKLNEIASIKRNYPIGNWNCDIVFDEKRLIVEFFGDFWHANPAKYQKDWINVMSKKTAEQIWERDKRKIEELRTMGYNVIIVWETDWKYHSTRCIEEIKSAFNSARPR